MSEKASEKSNMSSVGFAQFALRNHVAPPSIGSVKARLRHATRVMLKRDRDAPNRKRHWTSNRVRDCWYGDERITPNADEIRDLEEITGLRYGREELRSVETLIARADTLLDGPEADFFRPFVDAIRAMARAAHRTGT